MSKDSKIEIVGSQIRVADQGKVIISSGDVHLSDPPQPSQNKPWWRKLAGLVWQWWRRSYGL